MILALPAVLALVHQCAPGIAPEAILSIVSVESKRDPLAINVNHVGQLRAGTRDEAVTLANHWIEAGYSVDLGLAQINSHNLGWTGLSVPSTFDPCANLAAAEKILEASYSQASRDAAGTEAISRTFSLYNTGNITDGFTNTYVARVWRAASVILPALQELEPAIPDGSTLRGAGAASPAPDLARPSFVVGQADTAVLIFK